MTVGDQVNYVLSEMEAGRLTAKHIVALTFSFQDEMFADMADKDGKPGPLTRGLLESQYPGLFKPPSPPALAQLGQWLAWPLPVIRGNPAARRPKVTSGFRKPDRPDHDGLDMFYRWQVGDEPRFVGDGGCEGKNVDGSPKWVVPYGTSALAAAAGIVTVAGMSPTGYRVWVDHGNGWRTGYFHLQTMFVKPGETVAANTALGGVGHNPSPAKDGRHLHFELSPSDRYEPVDPEPCLRIT